MWLIYAFVGAVITAVGQVFVKRGQIKLTPLIDNLVATILVYVVLAPMLFVWGVDLKTGSQVIIYAFVVALMYALFYYIISFGNVSLMISLINTFPIVTIGLAIAFLGELPNIYQWTGIIFILSGIFCISREKVDEKDKTFKKHWLLWGLLGALSIGIAEFITELATSRTDSYTFMFFVYLMYLPPLLVFMFFDKKGRTFDKMADKKSLFFTIVGIFYIEVGLIFIALAYQYGLASLASPVIATHTVFTAILAVLLLKEKLLPVQKLGIALNLIGVCIIGIWS